MALTCKHCCTKIENLTVRFGNRVALENVRLHIHCGELIAVVGPNGAGKTTFLRAILGEIPSTGWMEFQVSGEGVRRPKIGYVPQKFAIDPDMPVSVRDFVALALSRRPVWLGSSRKLSAEVLRVLSVFSAEHLIDRKIGELSGGELQRVLLALAMTPKPDLLLLDEPNTGVDAKGLTLFYQTVSALRENHDVSIIMVTHDVLGIAPYADRMLLLNRTVACEGTPDKVIADDCLKRTFGVDLQRVSNFEQLAPHEKAGRQ